MADLRLPLWFVSERKPRLAGHTPPCNDPEALMVFTNTEPIAALFSSEDARQWKIDLAADRKELVAMIADLHERDVQSLCFNPNADGTGGEKIDLRALMAFCDTLPE